MALTLDFSKAVPIETAPSKDIDTIIQEASAKNGVPLDVMKTLVGQESGGNPRAVSNKGAMGAAQLMPGTAKDMGVTDPYDPEQNIHAGAKYLKQQYDKFGDWKLAAAAYNAGPGNVQKYGGVPPFPETQNYVKGFEGKGKETPVTLDFTKAIPIDQPQDVNQGLLKEPENAQPQGQSWIKRAKNFITTPLASPQQVHEGITSSGDKDLANAAAMSFGLMKPVDENEALKNQQNPDAQVLQGVSKGVSRLGSGLTSPLNMGLMAASAFNPGIGLAAAAPYLPSMLKGGYEGLKSGKEARESGQYEKAGENYTSGIADLLMGAGLAKGVGGIGKEIVAPSEPFNKAINPEIQKIAQEGYPLTAADIVQSRWQQTPQKMLEKNPMTSQLFKDFGDKQRGLLQEQVGDFKNDIGEAPPEEVSDAVKEGIMQKTQSFRKTSKNLYDKVSQLSGGKQSPLNNLSDSIQSVLKNEASALPGQELPGVVSKLSKTLENISPNADLKDLGIPGDKIDYNAIGKTFDEMKNIKSRYGKLAKSKDVVGTPEEGVYKQLSGAVGKDIDAFAEKHGGAILDAYQRANEFYAPGKRLLNSKMTRSLKTLSDENPSAIANAVIKPGQYRRIEMAKELLGDNFNLVKQQFAQNLISKSTVIPKGGTEPVIQGGKLLAEIQRYGNKNTALADKVLGEVFSPDELSQLKDLAKKASLSQSAVKASGASSARAGQMTTFGAVTKPLVGAVGYPVAKFLLSDFGRRLLSTKLPTPGIGRVAYPITRSLMKDQQQ